MDIDAKKQVATRFYNRILQFIRQEECQLEDIEIASKAFDACLWSEECRNAVKDAIAKYEAEINS